MELTGEEHKDKHIMLHRQLDELASDFLRHTGKLPSDTTVMELLQWSSKQTINPTEK